ncbi:MAG: DNA-directed RNA polymerase subunit omega [Phycisphaeraceae bacterium]|nr:DNA-directed RNA polymerase subunit omega [Phycisphaeraceae bacterium]
MIEALLNDDLVENLGGRFKLTALIQRRLAELVEDARPLVSRSTPDGRHLSNLEIAIEEIRQGKITIDWESSGLRPPSSSRKR